MLKRLILTTLATPLVFGGLFVLNMLFVFSDTAVIALTVAAIVASLFYRAPDKP